MRVERPPHTAAHRVPLTSRRRLRRLRVVSRRIPPRASLRRKDFTGCRVFPFGLLFPTDCVQIAPGALSAPRGATDSRSLELHMSYSWTEARTRQEIIDKRLALAGWNVDDPSQIIQASFLSLVRHVLGLEEILTFTE